jgi:hypothetical protein
MVMFRKRAAAIGMVNGFGNIGTVYGPSHLGKLIFSSHLTQDGFLHVEINMGSQVSSIFHNISCCARLEHIPIIRFVGSNFHTLQRVHIFPASSVIRQMLIRRNQKLDTDEKAALEGADQTRVAKAARLEGLTFEQAMERRKDYRYLY